MLSQTKLGTKFQRVGLFTLALALFVALAGPTMAEASKGDNNGKKHDRKEGRKHARLPQASQDSDFILNGQYDPKQVELGKLLYYDKILSGNKNISCSSCHSAFTNTGDMLSLPIGEGGKGIGPARNGGTGADAVHERVPRNAPAVFNLGATVFTSMFHDGRLEIDPTQPSGFLSPAGDDLPLGLNSILAAQALFPPTSGAEMAGQAKENTVGRAGANGDLAGPRGVWRQLARRVALIPEYANMMAQVYEDVRSARDITIVHVANAIAVYEASTYRADNSPFDKYLRGDKAALSASAKRGMNLFYGKLGCDECHSGVFQTDQDFHSIAMPQIGPGKGDGVSGAQDFGREAVTGNQLDRYRFRTPSLRNTALTGPWGHDGAFTTLESVVRHHLDPVESLYAYDGKQSYLPILPEAISGVDFLVTKDPSVMRAIAESSELDAKRVKGKDFKDLMSFMHALTDTKSLNSGTFFPKRVPSGLPIAD